MKKKLSTIIAIFFLSIIFLYSNKIIYAQTSCVSISEVRALDFDTRQPISQIDTSKKFVCEVTTNVSDSKNVACGVRVGNSTDISNVCPSDQYFIGWFGNKALFGCTIPPTSDTKNLTLVGHDFSPGCNTEKSISLNVNLEQGKNTSDLKPLSDLSTLSATRQILGDLFAFFSVPSPTTSNSSTATDTQAPSGSTTTVTNTSNSSAQRVIDMVNNINSKCGKGINSSNYQTCMYQITPLLPPMTLNQITSSVTAIQGGVLQCVGFVRAALGLFGKDLSAPHPGYAKLYATNTAQYVFINNSNSATIQPNDIVIWNMGEAGHIAYVVDVKSDNFNFTIAESNWDLNGGVQLRKVTKDAPNLQGWLRAR